MHLCTGTRRTETIGREISYQNYVLSWSENILALVIYDDARTTLQMAMHVAIHREGKVSCGSLFTDEMTNKNWI